MILEENNKNTRNSFVIKETREYIGVYFFNNTFNCYQSTHNYYYNDGFLQYNNFAMWIVNSDDDDDDDDNKGCSFNYIHYGCSFRFNHIHYWRIL